MRYFLLGVVLIAGWTTYARWHYVCKILNRCDENYVEGVNNAAIPRSTDLSVQLDDSTSLDNYEQFGFKDEKYVPILTTNNLALIDALTGYLKDHPNTLLKIIGFYLPSEREVSAGMQENIGMARAAVIRDIFIENGVATERFILSSDTADVLTRPIGFEIIRRPPDDFDFEIPQFTFTNMNFEKLRFKYNSSEFTPNAAFIEYADSVKTYFGDNSDKIIMVVGHTDNVASHKFNMKLGQDRADAVKNYLVSIGIDEKRITTDSKGKTAPVAPNDTEENRSKNRRVNTIIQSKSNES